MSPPLSSHRALVTFCCSPEEICLVFRVLTVNWRLFLMRLTNNCTKFQKLFCCSKIIEMNGLIDTHGSFWTEKNTILIVLLKVFLALLRILGSNRRSNVGGQIPKKWNRRRGRRRIRRRQRKGRRRRRRGRRRRSRKRRKTRRRTTTKTTLTHENLTLSHYQHTASTVEMTAAAVSPLTSSAVPISRTSAAGSTGVGLRSTCAG